MTTINPCYIVFENLECLTAYSYRKMKRFYDYLSKEEWKTNPNGNLIGINKETKEQCFTWQPHGSQFTIHTKVPEDAVKFRIKRPPTITKSNVLESINFDDSWVNIIR